MQRMNCVLELRSTSISSPNSWRNVLETISTFRRRPRDGDADDSSSPDIAIATSSFISGSVDERTSARRSGFIRSELRSRKPRTS